jgi:Domain of unknown function (DUF5666)
MTPLRSTPGWYRTLLAQLTQGGWLYALLAFACTLLLSAMLSACGGAETTASGAGGVGEDGTGGPAQAASIGVVTGVDEQSITVNGTTFERQQAPVQDATTARLPDTAVKPGMWVTVEGHTSPSGENPVADKIKVLPSARGEVSSVDHGRATISLLGNTVQISDTTLVEDMEGKAQPHDQDDDQTQAASGKVHLNTGDKVEVHGPLGATAGAMLASRIDKLVQLPEASQQPYQLRGRVSEWNAQLHTLKVGRQLVDISKASKLLKRALFTPTGELVKGMVVRVSGSQPPRGGQAWVVDVIGTDNDLSGNLGFLYMEGVVENLDKTSGLRFEIEDVPVNASSASGNKVLSSNGLRVSVIGPLRSGELVAKAVSANDLFTLSGTVGSFTTLSSFKVNTILIDASEASFLKGDAKQLGNGAKVWLSGALDGRTLKVRQIKVTLPAPMPWPIPVSTGASSVSAGASGALPSASALAP